MEGKHRVRGSRRRRRPTRSQATVEFAFVAPLFLLCFLATVDAGLWAVQSSAEVEAVQQAARVAASAGASPLSSVAPDARTVTATVAPRLEQALFATRIDIEQLADVTGIDHFLDLADRVGEEKRMIDGQNAPAPLRGLDQALGFLDGARHRLCRVSGAPGVRHQQLWRRDAD